MRIRLEIETPGIRAINEYGVLDVANSNLLQRQIILRSVSPPSFQSNIQIYNLNKFVYFYSQPYSSMFGTLQCKLSFKQWLTETATDDQTKYGNNFISNWRRWITVDNLDSTVFGTAHVRDCRKYIAPRWEVFTQYGTPKIVRYLEVFFSGACHTSYGEPSFIFSNWIGTAGFKSTVFGETSLKNRRQYLTFTTKSEPSEISNHLVYNLRQYFSFDPPSNNEAAFYGQRTNIHNRNRIIRIIGFDSFYWKAYDHKVKCAARVIKPVGIPFDNCFGTSWISNKRRYLQPFSFDSCTTRRPSYHWVRNNAVQIWFNGVIAHEFGNQPFVWNNRRYSKVRSCGTSDIVPSFRVSRGIQNITFRSTVPWINSLEIGAPSLGLYEQYIAPESVNPLLVSWPTIIGPFFRGFAVRSIKPIEQYGRATLRNRNRVIKLYAIDEAVLPSFVIDSSWHFVNYRGLDSLSFGRVKVADNKQYINVPGNFKPYITDFGTSVRNIFERLDYTQYVKNIGGLEHVRDQYNLMWNGDIVVSSMSIYTEGFEALEIAGLESLILGDQNWKLRNYYPATQCGGLLVTHRHRRINISTVGDTSEVPSSQLPGCYQCLAVSPFVIKGLGNCGIYRDLHTSEQPPLFGQPHVWIPGITQQLAPSGAVQTQFGTATMMLGTQYARFRSLSSAHYGTFFLRPFKQRLWFTGSTDESLGELSVYLPGTIPVCDITLTIPTCGTVSLVGLTQIENKNRPVYFQGFESLVSLTRLVGHSPRWLTFGSFDATVFGTAWVSPSPQYIYMLPNPYIDGMTEFDWTAFPLWMRVKTRHVVKPSGIDRVIMGNPTITNKYQYARIYQIAPLLFPCYAVSLTHG